ncbi:unnamed protein product [Urochloa decumbens]|uniref:AAA+ ATPase domain-containing protein n=1 Tax=Urochloa decumbens TaxID=240449 RepID=A0ABC9BNJ9_9POAL
MAELWSAIVVPVLAFLLGLVTLAMNQARIKLFMNKITAYFSSYDRITIPEYGAERLRRSELFVAVEAYLSDDTRIHAARKLKAELGSEEKKLQASIDDDQEIIVTSDAGVTLWWYAETEFPKSNVMSFSPGDEKRRFYRVIFHKSNRKYVLDTYLPEVIKKGRAAIAENRQHRLFTNIPRSRSSSYVEGTCWTPVAFQHPASFEKLAMDPREKKAIMDDLNDFKEGKGYYDQVGKAWKRGYLLFGPPGTGKSTMVAAMANHLKYDVYDLELTAVKNNTELRRLFVETKGKSIIVIEDIDRSLDLTVKRSGKKKKANKESSSESDSMTLLRKADDKLKDDDSSTKVTLSGLLNFIDGLWSACGGERIIIFTTNNKDKLDPALIRRGRMDKHIEMSYCRYEAFKVLATNYLKIEEHQFFELFGEIQQLLEKVDMSPADVAEHLITNKKDTDACLQGLLAALYIVKEKAKTVEAAQ